ncbi:hypothetical protein GEMRC1_007151 [Eukaryota sp. GEM-RC1]
MSSLKMISQIPVKPPSIRHVQVWNSKVEVQDNLLILSVNLSNSPPGSTVAMREQVAYFLAEEGIDDLPNIRIKLVCFRVPHAKREEDVPPTLEDLVKSSVTFNRKLQTDRTLRYEMSWDEY